MRDIEPIDWAGHQSSVIVMAITNESVLSMPFRDLINPRIIPPQLTPVHEKPLAYPVMEEINHPVFKCPTEASINRLLTSTPALKA